MEIQKIHEDVLVFLLRHKEDYPEFTFGFRKMNNSNRLKLGYWFNGDDRYVAIPFWTGRDWKNRTPNIFFLIGQDGSSFLEFSFTDSPGKRLLVDRIKENLNGVNISGRGYRKNYQTRDYISALSKFLNEDKPTIDDLIKLNSKLFQDEKGYNKIDFYSENEFQRSLAKINSIRFSNTERRIGLNQYIQSIVITSDSPKINVNIVGISNKVRWIFITGKNGVGKSSLLRAIAATLMSGRMHIGPNKYMYSIIPDISEIDLNVCKGSESKKLSFRYGSTLEYEPKDIFFMAYGPFRSRTIKSVNLTDKDIEQMALGRSLFFEDAAMLSLDRELLNQSAMRTYGISFSSIPSGLIQQLIEMLPDLIPQLVRIDAPFESTIENLWSETSYVFEDEQEKEFKGVSFRELSSGHKNLIGFLSDMIIRLISKQPSIEYLTELEGIVLIDEIDIHLHPIYQKSLVETLADRFPNLQFIVSTHSPIPILGAPIESMVLKAVRTVDEGITLFRVDDKMHLTDLLPNAILTSPVFGMDSITNSNRDSSKRIITGDDFNEIEFSQRLQSRIDDFLTDRKQEELIKLFEERRKK